MRVTHPKSPLSNGNQCSREVSKSRATRLVLEFGCVAGVRRLPSSPFATRKVRSVLVPAGPLGIPTDRFVPYPATRKALDVKRSDTLATKPGDGRCVSFPAGRQIRKLPLSQISQSMTGNQPVAVVSGPDPKRLLRPSSRPSPSTPSTSVHRRLRRRGLPSQQSAPVTDRSLTGRGLNGRCGSLAYIRCREIEGPLTRKREFKSQLLLTLSSRLSLSRYNSIQRRRLREASSRLAGAPKRAQESGNDQVHPWDGK